MIWNQAWIFDLFLLRPGIFLQSGDLLLQFHPLREGNPFDHRFVLLIFPKDLKPGALSMKNGEGL